MRRATRRKPRIASSSDYLREVMAEVPVLVIGAISVRATGLPQGNQAGQWGSLLPAAWSLAAGAAGARAGDDLDDPAPAL